MRMNVDAFNVFNHQNLNAPGSSSDSEGDGSTTGIICTTAGGVGCQSSNLQRSSPDSAVPARELLTPRAFLGAGPSLF